MQDGLERMYGDKQENVYYYITTLNENYHMPAMPAGAEEGIPVKVSINWNLWKARKVKFSYWVLALILRHVREAAQNSVN